MSSAKLLILDAYSPDGRAGLDGAGATRAGELYHQAVAGWTDQLSIDVIGAEQSLPGPLESYSGIIWTGSNLTACHRTPEVRAQIERCRAAYSIGIPQFGSCWAIQIAVVAAGGKVIANPLGWEFGIGRKILLTDAGRMHQLLAGKPLGYDGYVSHQDIVTELPDGASCLAYNAYSAVQAVSVNHGRGVFWGLQYHPEYNSLEIARLAMLRGEKLLQQGLFRHWDDLNHWAQRMEQLAATPSRVDLAYQLGLDDQLLNRSVRQLELVNWLRHQLGLDIADTGIPDAL